MYTSLVNQTAPSAAMDVLHHQHTSNAPEGAVWFTRLNVHRVQVTTTRESGQSNLHAYSVGVMGGKHN